MIINFNIERLDSLLLDFYKLTNLTISVWDSNFNQLSYQPRKMPTFCRLIKSTNLGNKRCFECDKILCTRTLTTSQPQSHRCHAGLIDTAIPIKFKDTVLGFMMFGQVTATETPEELNETLQRLSRELKLDETQLRNAHGDLTKYQPDVVKSAANILKMATRYLWLSDMIKINQDDLAEEIDEYIRANVDKQITIDCICKRFCISKNKLYSLSESRFNMTIGNYIQKIRIETAKNLLTTTDLPVYAICNAIGIVEYNYFTKVFKKQTGLTPLKYRKLFPLSLHN